MTLQVVNSHPLTFQTQDRFEPATLPELLALLS